MSKDLNPDKALIFRIVHQDNVGEVLANGCHCKNASKGKAYVQIGNEELISRRDLRKVDGPLGGTLSDYVPFYFTPYTPMLLNIITGYNGVTKRPKSEIMILISSLHYLKELGVEFVFSDRHAYLKAAQFSSDLADLNRIIWPTLQARDFTKSDLDKFEKYQAEALVHKHMPLNALRGIVCYDDSARAKIQDMANKKGLTVKIIAQPQWYL